MSRLEPTDELKFISWFKNEFVFENDEHQVHFTPNYRSDINPIITLESIIKEGCENIYIDGQAQNEE
mgnify:CR=1 FL=1